MVTRAKQRRHRAHHGLKFRLNDDELRRVRESAARRGGHIRVVSHKEKKTGVNIVTLHPVKHPQMATIPVHRRAFDREGYERRAFTRENGEHVEAAHVAASEVPATTFTETHERVPNPARIPIKKGAMHGYKVGLPEDQRHAILESLVRTLGVKHVHNQLGAMIKMREHAEEENEPAKAAARRVFQEDQHWLNLNYGTKAETPWAAINAWKDEPHEERVEAREGRKREPVVHQPGYKRGERSKLRLHPGMTREEIDRAVHEDLEAHGRVPQLPESVVKNRWNRETRRFEPIEDHGERHDEHEDHGERHDEHEEHQQAHHNVTIVVEAPHETVQRAHREEHRERKPSHAVRKATGGGIDLGAGVVQHGGRRHVRL